jgi:hypothetical protein
VDDGERGRGVCCANWLSSERDEVDATLVFAAEVPSGTSGGPGNLGERAASDKKTREDPTKNGVPASSRARVGEKTGERFDTKNEGVELLRAVRRPGTIVSGTLEGTVHDLGRVPKSGRGRVAVVPEASSP